jgi:RNA polymerase-binding transcription factor DksA
MGAVADEGLSLRSKVPKHATLSDYLLALCTRCRMTPAQEALQKKHGTPEEFEAAVVNALGEISYDEAQQAIRRYLRQWEAAGRHDHQFEPGTYGVCKRCGEERHS